VQNFFWFFLPEWLYTRDFSFSTSSVNSFLLIFSLISILSTILFSGAKLISLYLFSSKKRGKLADNPVFYAQNPQSGRVAMGYSEIIHKLLTGLSTHLSTQNN
jgi:hypothetical protein